MYAILIGLLITAAQPGAGTHACAHRGDNKNAPENTLPAFVSAVEKGAHQIEFDLQLTKDGQIVLMHDDTVDRTTDGTGRVADLTLDEVRALDAGSWFGPGFAGVQVPTFREVLAVIPHAILCNVHLKGAPEVGKAAAEVLVEMDRLDHCFLAATREQAAAAKTVAPGIQICNMSRHGPDRAAYAKDTIDAGAEFIQLFGPVKGLTEVVAELHAKGVTVNYFSAQEDSRIRELVQAGIDYILTDDLDLCLRIAAEYGVAPVRAASSGSDSK